MLLEVFLGEVLKVSLGERDLSSHLNLLIVVVDLEGLSEFAQLAVDLDALSEELCEVSGVKDLILNRLGAVNAEVVADFLLLGYFSVGLLSHGEKLLL